MYFIYLLRQDNIIMNTMLYRVQTWNIKEVITCIVLKKCKTHDDDVAHTNNDDEEQNATCEIQSHENKDYAILSWENLLHDKETFLEYHFQVDTKNLFKAGLYK